MMRLIESQRMRELISASTNDPDEEFKLMEKHGVMLDDPIEKKQAVTAGTR